MKWLYAAAALMIPGLATATSHAQISPSETEVLSVCASVIENQAQGEDGPDGNCIAIVNDWLDAIGAASPGADEELPDMVERLVELYTGDESCRVYPTELPDAIAAVVQKTFEEDLAATILSISEALAACDAGGTAAIGAPPLLEGGPTNPSPN
jgi:hypothetical protein